MVTGHDNYMGYYIAPRFLDRVAVHLTKNFLDLPGVKVPLILGIHGRKGEGKSFQCELIFKLMGIEPVRMSAGELESRDAGDPVRLIRLRYREAAELIKVRGKMCVLLINDLDAGAGRMDTTTQYTVNTQLVNGTLMNIADNPTDVQLPGSYDPQPLHRVPIIVTGNDFSTLYAPLVRDGRMEKFYWEPSQGDRLGIVSGIFGEDHLSPTDVEQLLAAFPQQSIDFFGALRSRVYDQQVRHFIQEIGIERVSSYLVNQGHQPLQSAAGAVTLPLLLELGQQLVAEQGSLGRSQLAQDYVSGATTPSHSPAPLSAPTPKIDWIQPPQPTAEPSHQGNGKGPLGDNIERLLEVAIAQGGQLGLEVATRRQKAGNHWRSWSMHRRPENAVQAMDRIQTCLAQNPNSFVRLIAYNPKTQTRLLEEIIARP